MLGATVPQSIVTAAEKAAAAAAVARTATLPTTTTVTVPTTVPAPAGISPWIIVTPIVAVSGLGIWWLMRRKKRR